MTYVSTDDISGLSLHKEVQNILSTEEGCGQCGKKRVFRDRVYLWRYFTLDRHSERQTWPGLFCGDECYAHDRRRQAGQGAAERARAAR